VSVSLPNPPQGVEYLPPLLALITIAICIPLVLRKVPPNLFYGVRTRKTLSDPRIWYEANYKGGITLAVGSMAALLCWAVLMLLWDRSAAAFLGTAAAVAAMVIASVVCLLQVRNL
jgi:uncharacterized membrane protein